MTSTTEEAVEAEDIKMDMDVDVAVDTTVAVDKNTVPMEAITTGTTSAAYLPEWTTKCVLMDIRQT